MSKCLIIQPSIPAYRVPFFECLADSLGYELTILHFGVSANINHPLINEILGSFIEFKGLKYILNLNSIIKNYTTIITVFDPHWSNAFLLPLTHTNKKIILWGHGLGKNNFINHVRKKLFQNSNAIITYDEQGKSKITELGIKKSKVFVANNTILVTNSVNTANCSKKNFLYVGRLQRRKRLDIFLDIFSELNLGAEGYSLTIVGNGKEEKLFLERYIEQLKIGKYVDFVTGTTNEDVLLSYFSRALYYVSPDAVGLGVLHSFAYGVPILTITSQNHGPEVRNIVNDKNSYIFDNKEQFKIMLPQLLASDKAIDLGNNAFKTYSNDRSIEQMVSGFIKAINS